MAGFEVPLPLGVTARLRDRGGAGGRRAEGFARTGEAIVVAAGTTNSLRVAVVKQGWGLCP